MHGPLEKKRAAHEAARYRTSNLNTKMMPEPTSECKSEGPTNARDHFLWLDGIAAAVAAQEYPATAFLVAHCIRSRVDRQTGEAAISQSWLASKTGLSTRTIRTLIGLLVQAGDFALEPSGGRGHVPRYRLKWRKHASADQPKTAESSFPLSVAKGGSNLPKKAEASRANGGSQLPTLLLEDSPKKELCPSSRRSDDLETEFNQVFWPQYPRHVAKQDAHRAFAVARRSTRNIPGAERL